MRVIRDLDSAAEYFISAGYIPRDLLKSEIELIRFLKVWTASWVPRVTELVVDDKREWHAGAGAKYIQQLLPPNDYWRKSTYELFQDFSNHKFAAICSHTAWTLMSVYESFGFKSFVYSYGDPPDSVLTHAITMVRLSNGDFYFQDADLGGEFFLGRLGEQMYESLNHITTNTKELDSSHEFLTRTFFALKEHVANADFFNFTWPPVNKNALQSTSSENSNLVKFYNVSVDPISIQVGINYESATKFLTSKGRTPILAGLIAYPLGLANREIGYVDSSDGGDSLSANLFSMLNTFHLQTKPE